MATYKNTRPTIIQRPNGGNVMPGGTFTPEDGELDNPGMRKFAKAGFIKEVQADGDPPPVDPAKVAKPPPAKVGVKVVDAEAEAKARGAREEAAEKAKADRAAATKAAQEKAAQVLKDAQEKAGKVKRDAKIVAVKAADAEALLKMADGETDAEVNAAIEARAAELAPKG